MALSDNNNNNNDNEDKNNESNYSLNDSYSLTSTQLEKKTPKKKLKQIEVDFNIYEFKDAPILFKTINVTNSVTKFGRQNGMIQFKCFKQNFIYQRIQEVEIDFHLHSFFKRNTFLLNNAFGCVISERKMDLLGPVFKCIEKYPSSPVKIQTNTEVGWKLTINDPINGLKSEYFPTVQTFSKTYCINNNINSNNSINRNGNKNNMNNNSINNRNSRKSRNNFTTPAIRTSPITAATTNL
ncbi:hypothetical protein ACTA71_001938 [Dictyostelium dimigraforme]